MDRDLGVDIFTAVSWRGVRMSGVLKGCSDGKVVCDTNVCSKLKVAGELQARMYVKDVRVKRKALTLISIECCSQLRIKRF